MNSPHLSSPSSRRVAAALIESGCVSVRTDEPFRLPSGWASPVYMDCRRLISFPAARQTILTQALAVLQERNCVDGLAGVAGGESSGIALAAWIAHALNLPMQYVRKRAAGERQIEGVIHQGDKVLLVDDLMAAGHSKLRFCKALIDAGAQVEDLLVVFSYGTFPLAAELDTLNVRVHALATWQDVLAAARERGDFPASAIDELRDFLDDPVRWSQSHGGLGAAVSGAANT
ncbi:MAG: orotate phosphoribosyltransferase [Burkholderiaceae bacterium]